MAVVSTRMIVVVVIVDTTAVVVAVIEAVVERVHVQSKAGVEGLIERRERAVERRIGIAVVVVIDAVVAVVIDAVVERWIDRLIGVMSFGGHSARTESGLVDHCHSDGGGCRGGGGR